jgi:Bifunctional DNA primase/polymerase, N-terminal
MIVAGLGNLPCFACRSDKRPLIHDWPNRAECIEPKPWWPLVGVPTGIAFDVIDIDPLGLPWLETNRHLLQTRAHKTKRAWHFLFQPSGVSGSNDDRIAAGVDVRAKGNFIVWWPRQGLEVIDLPLAPWPEELLEKARSKAKVHSLSAHRLETPRGGATMPRVVVSRNSREGRYAWAALRNAFDKLANWPRVKVSGQWQRLPGRNTMLNKLAFKMGGLVTNAWIDEALVVRVLMLAAAECGLVHDDGEAQCLATIHSGLQAGMQLPYPQLEPRYG